MSQFNMFTISIQFDEGLFFLITKRSHQFNFNVSCGSGELSSVKGSMNDEKTSNILEWILGPVGPALLSYYRNDNVIIEVTVSNECTNISIKTYEEDD